MQSSRAGSDLEQAEPGPEPSLPGPNEEGVTDREPTRIVVDLSRKGAPDKPREVVGALDDPEYRRHSPGQYAPSATLSWADLQSDFHALVSATTHGEIKRKLSQSLWTFLGELSFAKDEATILQAEGKRRVDVIFRFSGQELYALPWELAPVGGKNGRFLGSLEHCLIQYELPEAGAGEPLAPEATPRDSSADEEGGRILFASAGVPKLDAAHERAIGQACHDVDHPFDSAGDCVREVSLSSLDKALGGKRPAAVLHLLCHGAKLESAFGVVLRKDDGSGEEVIDPSVLAEVVARHKASLRLVVLCVCQSGAAVPESVLGSVAMELHRAGIQAVVASRFPLSKAGSCDFTEVFYRALLVDLCSLQQAFLAGRARLLTRLREDQQSIDGVSLQLFARAAHGADIRPFVVRPYRGLLSFSEKQQRFFFGREHEIQEAREDILALLADPSRPRLFFVTGGSGRGKSSLVPAGVVPALAGDWPGVRVATVRPSAKIGALHKVLSDESDRDLLLIVDQFEELFTSLEGSKIQNGGLLAADAAGSGGERAAYFDALWQLAADPHRKTLVVATMRVDFLARTGEIHLPDGRSLEDLLYEGCHGVFLAAMNRAALERVVKKPAQKVGLVFEHGLADAILDEAGVEPGNLPLLQHVLDELWKRRAGRILTWIAYRDELGGLGGALEKRANEVFAKMSPAEQAVTRSVLVRLVATYDDTTQGTRRVVRRSELDDIAERSPEQLDAVLALLTRERLLLVEQGVKTEIAQPSGALPAESAGPGSTLPGTPDSLIEIAHEALIRKWVVLYQWVRAQQVVDRDLRPFALLSKKKHSYVEGVDVGLLRQVVSRHGDLVPEPIRALLLRSEKRARNRRIWLGVMGGAAWLVALGMALVAGFAWKKKGEAEELKAVAEAEQTRTEEARREAADRRDAARRQAFIAGSRALLSSGEPSWAVELLRLVNKPEATPGFVEAANEVLERRPPWATFRGRMAKPSPDGRWLATAEWHGGTLYIHRIDHQGSPVVVPTGPQAATDMAWSPDGGRLAVTFEGGAIRVVDPTSGEVVSLREGQEGDIATKPTFSADGRVFAAIGNHKARLWTGGLAEIGKLGADVHDLQVSPDGRYVLVINEKSRVDLWTLDPAVACKGAKQQPRPCRVEVLADSAAAASFSHESWRVSIMRDSHFGDAVLETWLPEDWTRPRTATSLPEHDLDDISNLLEVRPLADEAWLFVSGQRSKLFHHNKWRELPGSEPATASRDMSRVAVTSDAGVRVVDVADAAPSSRMIELWSQSGAVNDVVFGPDGRWVVTSSLTRGTSRLFRLGAQPSGIALASETGAYDSQGESAPMVSTRADIAVASSRDGGAYLWDLKGSAPPTLIPGESPRLSADGRRVVTIEGGHALVITTAPPHETKKIGPNGCDVVDAALQSGAGGDNGLVVVCRDGTVRSANTADAGDSQVLAAMNCPQEEPPLLSETGRSALFFCEGSDAWAFSIDRGLIPLPPACPSAAEWKIAPDGMGVACFALDEVVFLDLDHPDTIRSWSEPGVPIDGVTWSPDSHTAAVTTTNSDVHVFRLGPGERFDHRVLTGNTQLVHSVSFDRIGQRIAMASWDGLRVLSLDRDEPALSLGHRTAPTEVTRVALSEDGREILFMGGDSVVRRYSLSGDELRSRLENITTDCLPAEIRRAYAGETVEQAEKAYQACECLQGRCNQGM